MDGRGENTFEESLGREDDEDCWNREGFVYKLSSNEIEQQWREVCNFVIKMS